MGPRSIPANRCAGVGAALASRGRIGRFKSASDLTYASRRCVRTQSDRGRVVVTTMQRRRNKPQQIVYGQTQSFDSYALANSTDAAPLRSPADAEAADRRAAREPGDPWDPWPAQRIGYDSPAPASLFLPERGQLERLRSYLACLG